jgi:hypothetical protein
VRHRTCQAVELRHDERITLAHELKGRIELLAGFDRADLLSLYPFATSAFQRPYLGFESGNLFTRRSACIPDDHTNLSMTYKKS